MARRYLTFMHELPDANDGRWFQVSAQGWRHPEHGTWTRQIRGGWRRNTGHNWFTRALLIGIPVAMGLRMTWAVLGAIEKDPDPQNAGQGDAATPTTFPTRVQVGAFAVNFPGEPKVDEAETPLPAGGTTTAHRFEFIRGDSGFHAMWILRPLETNEEPFEAARASVNGIKDMFNVIPGFVSVATEKQGERSFGDRVGWSATYVIRLAGKTPTEMKERIDCVSVDPKMHCFMTTDGPSRRFGDAVTSEFFNHIVVSQ